MNPTGEIKTVAKLDNNMEGGVTRLVLIYEYQKNKGEKVDS